MLHILGWWVKTTVHFILSNKHSPLHHSNSWEFSYPCCPSQRIFPPSAIQTLVSLSGNKWSVGWSCYPACRCYLLDVFGSRTLESLSIHEGRRLHNRLYIMWSFSVLRGLSINFFEQVILKAPLLTNSNIQEDFVTPPQAVYTQLVLWENIFSF